MSATFHIVREHPLLIPYIDKLQRENAESVAFYPLAVFERERERHRLLLGLLNGEPCGYLYLGSGKDGVLRCHQVAIQYDARRRLYGAMLVLAMEEEAVARGVQEIALRCGADLEANTFWQEMGYACIHHSQGGIRRQRTINHWRKAIEPGLFSLEHIEPAKHSTSAAFWRKHKHTGIVTQFVRGKAMRDYRALLERSPDVSLTASPGSQEK